MSQRSFSKLLNWEDTAIYRYENGAIQSKEYNNILSFLQNPENMKQYLKENEINLDDGQIAKLLLIIEKLIKTSEIK